MEKVLEVSTGNYKKEIDEISKSVDELSSKLSDLSSTAQDTADAQNNTVTSTKEWKRQIDELKASMLQMDSSSAEYASTLEKVQDMQNRLNQVMADSKKNTNAAEGSYNSLVQTMSELKKAWRATTDETERTNIGKQILEINNQLKGMDASIGNYQRNVGDYANSFKSAFGAIGGEGAKAIESVTTKLGGVKTALTAISSHPIVAVLVVLLGIIIKCYQAFASTEEGAHKMAQAFSAFNGIGVVFQKLMQAIGEIIASVVIPAINVLVEILNVAVQGLGYLVSSLGSIFGLENLKEAGESMKNIADEEERSLELTKRRQEWEKKTRDLMVKESEEQIKISDLRAKAMDKENYSVKERKKFLEEAHKLEQQILKEKIKQAEINLQIIHEENIRNKSSKEALDREAQATVELNRLKAELNNNDRSFNKEMNRISKESKRETAQANSAADRQRKLQEERNKAEQKYLDYLKQEATIQKELIDKSNYYNKVLSEREENARYNKEVNDINNTKHLTDAEKATMLGIASERHTVNTNKINSDYATSRAQSIYNERSVDLEQYKGNVSYFYDELEDITTDYYDREIEIEKDKFAERLSILTENLEKEVKENKINEIQRLAILEDEASAQKALITKLEQERTNKILEIRQKGSEAEILQMSITNEALYNNNLQELNKYGVQYLEVQSKNSDEAVALRKKTIELENEMEESYYLNQVNIAQKRLDDIKAFGKGATESVEEYQLRIQQAEMAVNEALNNMSGALYNLSQTQNSNDNYSLLQDFKISESVYAMREAKYELENIYQEEGENFEAYLARKLAAQDKYNKARDNRIKAEEKSWKSLATNLGGIIDTMVDMDNERLEYQVENGKMSREEAERQFENNKKFQIASAVISMLAGATGIYMSTMKDDTIQPTWLRPALAATQMAGVLVTGIAQIQKIKNTQFGSDSSSSSMSSGAMSASVTPLLDEGLDQNSYTQLNTESNNNKDTRVYVVESDISDAQNKVSVRENASTF